MFDKWRHRRAVQRVKPGDGRALKRSRWWQLSGRALFHFRLTHDDNQQAVYAVDVSHWGNQSSGEGKAHLYLDGRHHTESQIPAKIEPGWDVVPVRAVRECFGDDLLVQVDANAPTRGPAPGTWPA